MKTCRRKMFYSPEPCQTIFTLLSLWGFTMAIMAGVVEMLLQSHEEYIELLPALPKEWINGSFKGLVARGNFVMDAEWADGHATRVTVTSRNAGEFRLTYAGVSAAKVFDEAGKTVAVNSEKDDQIHFHTNQGDAYELVW